MKTPSSLTLPILTENSNVAERAAVNASPLIFLPRAGLLDLLQQLSSEIIVPEIVATEIEIRGKSDPTAQAIERTANTRWSVTRVENIFGYSAGRRRLTVRFIRGYSLIWLTKALTPAE